MPQLPPALKNLLIVMALMGLAQVALPNIGFNPFQLYLYFPDSYSFRLWQLVTHVFCHGDIGHFIFNGIALFSFGLIVELRLGSTRFLQLFFISALGAVLFHFAAMAYSLYGEFHTLIPNHLAGFEALQYPPMLGASGAVYGVMVAFAVLYPNETLLFLFIPYPIKAKYLVPIMVGLDIVLGLGSFSGDNVAHFAHIGGAATGLLMIFVWKRLDRQRYNRFNH
ncbi:MAG: rhomboid family intramembrane serine protease [Bacteroidota bacterium]